MLPSSRPGRALRRSRAKAKKGSIGVPEQDFSTSAGRSAANIFFAIHLFRRDARRHQRISSTPPREAIRRARQNSRARLLASADAGEENQLR
ncbi:MAG TPA: hypothetical protein VEK12_09110 [Alphaproteobacteria bacterium]|nr:hypothetical protein [Alphaproteobacteria bacterium]